MFNPAVTDILLKAENFTVMGYKLGPNYEFLVLPVTGFQKNYICSGYLPSKSGSSQHNSSDVTMTSFVFQMDGI